MSDSDNQTNNLEQALLDRANRIAEEYLQRANEQKEDIHRELREKLHIREERELLAAREKAERVYLQHIQSTELQLQSKLDHFRWQMISRVLDDLLKKLSKLAGSSDEYIQVLEYLVKDAAAAIPSDELILVVNKKDREYLISNKSLLEDWLPGKKVLLSDAVCDCTGGAQVHDRKDRIRVNNTFEGRISMLHDELEESAMEELFSKTMTTGEMLHG